MPNTEQSESLNEVTMILNLELGRVTNRRKLASETEAIETEVDRDMLHVSVDLFDAPELKACQKFLNALKAQVRDLSVPARHLRGGMYMVKIEAIEQVDSLIEMSKAEFTPLVHAFADVVEDRREEARERLGKAYDASKYPTKEQVLTIYKIKHSWLTLGTPSSLKKLNKAIYDREVQKAEEGLKVAVQEITTMLTIEAKKLADHMVERLTPDADGKPKVFRNSIVSNITEFLANFNLRNVGTSVELETQVSRMRKLIEGVNPDDLRDSDQLREDVADGFKKVSETLNTLVVDQPVRFMDLSKE